MKNMKKLLRKAMVFTLTAAMLVGTPLTASAASLVDLYKVEDGEGNTIPDQGNPDNPHTGTVTVTQTYSASTTLETEQEPIGIYLNSSSIDLEYPESAALTAAIDWGTADGSVPDKCKNLNDDMLKNLVWKSDNTKVVALEVPGGKYNGGSRATINVNPKMPGTATVTVSLTSKDGKYDFSASAVITVIRYADELKFKEEIKEEACVGNSINLDDYVDRYIDGEKVDYTSDKLAFSLKLDESNANKNCATLKNGVLALKKEGNIKILAVGQKKGTKVGTGWLELAVKKGANVKKITFDVGNKCGILVNDSITKKVTALIEKDSQDDCKNRITWTSKKPAIVEIEGAAANLKLNKSNTTTPESTVTLKAKAPGKAQIEAKASNGKKATLTVTVSANLTSIKIEGAPTELYSGQTIDLYDFADQYFEKNGGINFTDAGLKWSFDGDQRPMKKVASINAKGVLTIKPDITNVKDGTNVIKVKAVNAKKVDTKKPGDISSNVLSIKLTQVNVTSITVSKANKQNVASATAQNGKVSQGVKGTANTDTLAVDKNETYTLVAMGTIGDSTETVTLDSAVLGWTSNNGKIAKASRDDKYNGVIKAVKKGTATVTINSATKKVTGGKTKYVAIKTTFKEKVTAPTKTLTLNVKNKGIVAKAQKQTITVTPVIEKGSTTNKNNDIIWSATMSDGSKAPSIEKGKIKNYVSSGDLGKEIIVTARVKNGGPSATIVLPIIQPTKKVKFTPSAKQTIADGKPLTVTTTIDIQGGALDQVPGKNSVSGVTYTVNKEGIVRIRDLGDGKLEINPVTNGTVKITATTLDGKKGNLTVTVKDVKFANEFWAPMQ